MIVIQMGATAMRCGDEPSLLSALLPLLTGDRRPACSGHNLTQDAARRTLFVCVLSIRLAVLLREAALWPLRLVKRPDENERGAGVALLQHAPQVREGGGAVARGHGGERGAPAVGAARPMSVAIHRSTGSHERQVRGRRWHSLDPDTPPARRNAAQTKALLLYHDATHPCPQAQLASRSCSALTTT